jgi:protein phosphatase
MMKLSFSAVSHIGEFNTVNDDRIYANGKFTASREMDNVQLSFEGRDKHFVFAVSEGMESEEENNSPGISVTGELVRFQKKARTSIKDIQVKLEDMTECIEQLNNLLYSMTIGDETKKGKKPSFSGLIFENGRAAAVNLGSSRVYKLEAENLRPLANDQKRAERLLKMGIITDEQAEMLSGQMGVPKSESLSQVRKSDTFKIKERDVLLICSNGLTDAVNEETIFEILSSEGDSDELAALLVNEAVDKGAKDNVTAAVVKIISVDEEAAASKSTSQGISSRLGNLAGAVGKRKPDTAKLISNLVFFVVIAAVLFGTYSLIMSLRPHDKDKDSLVQNGTTIESTMEEDTETSGTITEGSDTGETQETDAISGGGENAGNSGSEATTYKIQKGDSLYIISKKFYGDPQKYTLIMEANGITDPNKITAGQELKIPALK